MMAGCPGQTNVDWSGRQRSEIWVPLDGACVDLAMAGGRWEVGSSHEGGSSPSRVEAGATRTRCLYYAGQHPRGADGIAANCCYSVQPGEDVRETYIGDHSCRQLYTITAFASSRPISRPTMALRLGKAFTKRSPSGRTRMRRGSHDTHTHTCPSSTTCSCLD
ncbi:uncharacterized protein K460DRAFT_84704 [Cucurbitaria berberidis CBS 394.84]|uniref:Uncharacterized protein n=1 Tax=Cucurbitaria berberidis CBS 394.84 TaxID=1168544 RepID=A0A9P4GNS7_9PLEO|nr:uncharacterized protein K460DRAFT_84704 [Cucurbitaria berberidis CBS 394.84]KAF1849062.1 hypothetical protein K460DRAFT_84704 [Cucurbitaria berberidis CBS 394.84]